MTKILFCCSMLQATFNKYQKTKKTCHNPNMTKNNINGKNSRHFCLLFLQIYIHKAENHFANDLHTTVALRCSSSLKFLFHFLYNISKPVIISSSMIYYHPQINNFLLLYLPYLNYAN